MKILCSSDIHSEMPTLSAFASSLDKSNYDCGILAGDLIDEYPTASEAIEYGLATQDDFKNGYNQELTIDDLEKQIQNVNEMFANRNSILMKTLERKRDLVITKLNKIGKPVFMLLGNHDKVDWASKGVINNIHNSSVDYLGYRFIGYRYTLMEKSEQEIEIELKELERHFSNNMIFITHSPPYGVLDKTNNDEHIGSKAIKEFVKLHKPRLHVFGHVHEAFGAKGISINASYFTNRKFVSVNIK